MSMSGSPRVYSSRGSNQGEPPVEAIIAEEEKEWRHLRKTELILNIVNMLFFGLGIVFFTFGILYVTVYSYDYSFTNLSLTLFAICFIVSGFLQMVIAVTAHFTLKSYTQPQLLLLYALVTALVFLFFIILAIFGLATVNNGQLLNEARDTMAYYMRSFEERTPYKYETRAVNWIQMKFLCCGIELHTDWKAMIVYGGAYAPQFMGGAGLYNNPYNALSPYGLGVGLINPMNQVPYIEDVPDSCCITVFPNCGKQVGGYGMRDKTNMVNKKGCLVEYWRRFSNDITFVSSLSLCVSLGTLFITGALCIAYSTAKKNYNIPVRTHNYSFDKDEESDDPQEMGSRASDLNASVMSGRTSATGGGYVPANAVGGRGAQLQSSRALQQHQLQQPHSHYVHDNYKRSIYN